MNFTALLSPEGQQLLASLPAYSEDQAFTLNMQLRKAGHSPELIAAVLTQSRLRTQAHAKIGPAASTLIFTQNGLEQATRPEVAKFHAEHLLGTGTTSLVDFGCGIGMDSYHFAKTGLHVHALEIDEPTASAAAFNLQNFPAAQVHTGDGHEIIQELQRFHNLDAIWLDPARRANGKRIYDPEKWSPKLSEAIALARRFKAAGIKVAPGIDYTDLPEDAHVTWISCDGTLVEAVLWLGAAATPPAINFNLPSPSISNSTPPANRLPIPGRSFIIFRNGTPVASQSWSGDPSTPSSRMEAQELGQYLYEPDPAVIRSGLLEKICADYQLAPISAGVAYLSSTSTDIIDDVSLTAFKVQSVFPLDPKIIRANLLAQEIGIVEIKKRGVDIDPEQFRKKLKLNPKHRNQATIILSPLLGSKKAILCQRH